MNKILLIGCGHMGSALLKAWSKKSNNSFLVVDPNKNKIIKNNFNKKISIYQSLKDINKSILNQVDIVLFAIKPQIAKHVLVEFKNFKFNNKNIIFVSIVAGVKFSFYNKFISNKKQFIRAMPNMPALINMGMTCLIANKTFYLI